VVHVDETSGSREPDEPNRTASAPHQEVPTYPSEALYHTEPYRRDEDRDHNLRVNYAWPFSPSQWRYRCWRGRLWLKERRPVDQLTSTHLWN
jgi:hypothetical protein